MPTTTLFETPTEFDLDAYRVRIGVDGDLPATVETLHRVHAAHAANIPFENLDILLGRGIRVDAAAVVAKLVHARRGGYCFEQNLLLGAALEAIGFPVRLRLGRVLGGERMRPRTHLVLEVEVDGELWHADCGFGANGLLNPMRKEHGAESPQFRERYRMTFADGLWSVEALRDGGWRALYQFGDEPQLWVDVQMANFYVAHHPDSIFRQVLTVQLVRPDGKRSLRNEMLTITDANGDIHEEIVDDDRRREMLAQWFGLEFPEGVVPPIPTTEEAG